MHGNSGEETMAYGDDELTQRKDFMYQVNLGIEKRGRKI